MEYGKKTENHGNEKYPIDDLKNTKSLKNLKNEKCTLQDLEYGEKTENHRK